MDKLEKTIGYTFKNRAFLVTALTHSSYANENKHLGVEYNERLEFLGDAVLGFIVGSYVFKHFPEIPEGELTKLRASVVCETMLSKKSKAMNIGEFMRLGRGEEMTGGRTRISILADAFEAIIGAIYMDGGIEPAEKFILSQLEGEIKIMRTGFKSLDSKTNLQEIIQQTSKVPLIYSIIDEKGPAHNKEFFASVSHNGKVLGTGSGSSKKEAEQAAAQQAIEHLGK
ncbi:MAG: ribonuclease III [Firmicutes bacterium]|nr:ribonuclease III [Bacillota bacterium]